MEKVFKEYSILYAEDDDDMRINYTNYLSTLFNEAHQASDGLEALATYEKYLPDILLLDISMPGIDGLELAKKIRERDEYVKIIILTAHGEQEKLLNAVKLNLVDYLLKPVKRADFLETLHIAVKSIKNNDKVKKPIRINQDTLWYQDRLELYANNKIVHLTIKEKVLLSLLISDNSNFHSIEMIIDYFYSHDSEFEMTPIAIRGIIKRLKAKLPHSSLINDFGVGYKISTLIKG
ncbi:MAG: DNA-binding response OmpR family regulator [Sulfurimonas sp.]|jgi:DNA-binding response OmpR family regulator|uniref:response regulator transcription factor n=1 Tax=Sulfurimonas sp. TaxID=2022749 RepID=UPI0039E5CC57